MAKRENEISNFYLFKAGFLVFEKVCAAGKKRILAVDFWYYRRLLLIQSAYMQIDDVATDFLFLWAIYNDSGRTIYWA